MMDVYSVDITASSSSFRIPTLISGPHLTLTVPPISTVLGMINAAAGRYLSHDHLLMGYYFEYAAQSEDLQTIHMRQSGSFGRLTNTVNFNVISREFLYKTFIRIYSPDEKIINYFVNQYYPLSIGRGELARVDIRTIGKRMLTRVENAGNICGQIIPFTGNYLPGMIQALPVYFTNTLPREPLGKQPYSILDYQNKVDSKLTAYRDQVRGREVDIYFHEIDTESL